MVAAATTRPPALRLVTLGVCGVFLCIVTYLTLRDAVTPGPGPGARPPEGRLSTEEWRKRTPGELTAALEAAAQRLSREPIDADTLVTLSRIAAARGDEETSERLKLAAGAISPRAARIQAEVMTVLLRRRDFETLTRHMDGLLRARPEQAEALMAILADLARDPEATSAIARVMNEAPPWRNGLLTYLVGARNQPQLAQGLLTEMRAQGGGSDPTEIALVVGSYLRAGETDRAYYVWLDSLSPAELKSVTNVYDGGFSHPINGLSFDWTFRPAEGYSYRVFPRNTASMDKTLQIDFLDFEGTFSHLSQRIRLIPGRYRLSADVKAENLETPQGLALRLYCTGVEPNNPGSERLLDETPPLPRSEQWIVLEKTMTVPDAGCPEQILRLESLPTASEKTIMRGQIALDNITIKALNPLAP